MNKRGVASPTHFEPWFTVSSHVLDGAAFVAVSGELDLATGHALAGAVHNHNGHYERVIFDLGDLDFMDVAGFRALLDCADGDTVVSVRNPCHATRRFLELVSRADLIEEDHEARNLATADG